MKLKKISKINAVGLVGTAALSLLAVAMLCPAIADQSSAKECGTGQECEAGYSESVAPLNADVAVASMISISLDNAMQIDVTPISTGLKVENKVASLKVNTNNTSGYSLYMTGVDGNTKLTNTAESSEINTIGAAGALTANTWGYKLNKSGATAPTNYSAIPATSTGIGSTNTVNTQSGDSYDLTIGVAVDSTLPAGLYSGSVVVSAVANPIKITTLRQLVYMQDMTSEICGNTTMEETKQLIDSRDGKKYWVAKLRDGNCWMTQNLALDLSTSKTLTPADTNVTANYTPNSNTDAVAFTGTAGNTGQENQYSWGKWKNTVLATPLFGRNCNSNRGGDQYNSIISSEQLYDVCSGEGFKNVEGWSPTYTAQDGQIVLNAGNAFDRGEKKELEHKDGSGSYTTITYPYTYKGLIAVDETAQTYDAHYLVGNYYQYNAATAGTGTASVVNANAPSSICPKGWTLPRSGNKSEIVGSLNANNGTFYNLLNAYGVAGKVSSEAGAKTTTLRDYTKQLTATAIVDGGTTTYDVTANQFNIASQPLYFVRSGYTDVSYSYLRDAGHLNYSWSPSSNADTLRAYNLRINDLEVFSSAGPFTRYLGFSLRCLQE